MTTDRARIESELQFAAPKTFAGLKNMVMAAAKVFNSRGKKTWLGRDKQAVALVKFERDFESVLWAMHEDRLITSATSDADVASKAEVLIQAFGRAYPNWQDAYAFLAYYLACPEAAARIHEVQEGAYAFDNPVSSRGN